MKRTYLLILLICSVFYTPSFAVDSQHAPESSLLTASEKEQIGGGNYSFYMLDNATGKVVANKGGQRCATPASITKAITTATALELLGPDFRFKTQIRTTGHLEKGVLHGDLIIKGGGDPTLGSIYLGDINFINHWVQVIKHAGIREIEGNIIADATLFDTEPLPVNWTWEDIGNYYAAGVFGLSAYDNMYRITFNSGEAGTTPMIVNTFPTIPNIILDNQLKALKIGKDSCYIYGIPYDNHRLLVGGIPANRERYTVRGDITNPPLLVVNQLNTALLGAGVAVKGKTKVASQATDTLSQIIYTNQSRPLKQIIRMTNFKSNNNYAEHLYKYLGTLVHIPSGNGVSHRVLMNYWKDKGISQESWFQYDGCGLSPENAFSARVLSELLYHMSQSENYAAYKQSLPTAGREGTVAGFLRRTPLEGKAHVKSGSIRSVQCYAGYIDINNKSYSFAIMMNHYACSRRTIRKIITRWLVEAVESNS